MLPLVNVALLGLAVGRSTHVSLTHTAFRIAGARRLAMRTGDNDAANNPGFSNPLPPPTGKRVDEIVDFPTMLRFKIVGVNDETFVSDMEALCGKETGRPVTATKMRDNGKYRSITMDLVIDSAAHFYSLYSAVGKDARVKFMI